MQHFHQLVVGDINLDLIVQGLEALPEAGKEQFVKDIQLCLGGSAANTATALAKLGAKVGLWAFLGDDEFGSFLKRTLIENGVDTRYISVLKGTKTGLSVALSNHIDRSFISYAGTNEMLDLNVKDEVLEQTGHLHISGFNWQKYGNSYRQLLERARQKGLSTSMDLGWTNFDNFREDIIKLLPFVDYFFPNETEALALTKANNVKSALLKLAEVVKVPIITMGVHGAYTYWQDREIYQSAFSVKGIDAVGAGDAFDAGFLWAVSQGVEPPDALRVASACGALTASGIGGAPATPKLEALQDFLRSSEPQKTHVFLKQLLSYGTDLEERSCPDEF